MNANPDNSNAPVRTTLSDEQLSELLAMPVAPNETAEVAEVEHLRSALGDYRAEMLQWAERRSAVQGSLLAAAQRSRFWTAVPQWTLAAVAVVAVAAGTVFVTSNHVTSSPANEETASMTVSAPAPKADIAEDNRLLNSIDQELSYHGTTPVDGFGLSAAHDTDNTKPAARAVEVTD